MFDYIYDYIVGKMYILHRNLSFNYKKVIYIYDYYAVESVYSVRKEMISPC